MTDHHRFFIDPESIHGDTAVITGPVAHQIGRVLRLTSGDRITLLDGRGCEYSADITALSKDSVTARILGTSKCSGDPGFQLTLAMCLPKGDKLDLIVQKCGELGISRMVILRSERSVTRLDDDKAAVRLQRWRKIAAEACEQSGRGIVPEISGVADFSELRQLATEHSLSLVAWEDEAGTSMRQALRKRSIEGPVMVVVGPEGGLTSQEIELAREAGCRCVSLGKRTLRCETAAMAACAVIVYELESGL